jgi:SAM-dependent methyltransferase
VQKHVSDDWFVGFMDGLKAEFWRGVAEPWADDDAAAVAALLDLPPGARVLDAPCGGGRIAVRLAERGLRVTGIDISAPEIAEARRVAAERGADVTFEIRDVRDTPTDGFDGLVCWGNSFGYLPHHGTVQQLEAARRSLRDGGRLVLETATAAESALPLADGLDYDTGTVRMRGRSRYDARGSRILTDLEFSAPGRRSEKATVVHHVHTVGEIVRLLEAVGFKVDELLGDPAKREPFSPGAARLVVLAQAR